MSQYWTVTINTQWNLRKNSYFNKTRFEPVNFQFLSLDMLSWEKVVGIIGAEVKITCINKYNMP